MESSTSQAKSTRLECLDALRGIAALGVVFWHFQHFGGDPSAYPYVTAWGTSWLYTRGWVLVDFFFLLSGIVFTFKYLDAIADKKISGRDFMVLRFSRIYPLHLATLVTVAVVQWTRLYQHKPTLLYQNNDAYHFVLNLFFLQAGWFEDGYSYNNPSWSVASEVFVYVTFFFVAHRYGRLRYPIVATILALLGMSVFKLAWTYPMLNGFTSRATLGFFAGSLLYLVLRRINAARYGTIVGSIALACFGVIVFMVESIGYDAFIGGASFRIVLSHVMVVFSLILTIALTFPWFARILSLKPLTFLGDISYSVYLLHVPVQMIILAVLEAKKTPVPTSEPSFFWTFLGILLVAATLSHRFFEIPVQNLLRRRLLKKTSS